MATASSKRDVAWIEGVRGITALFIVTYHLFVALDDSLKSPTPGEEFSLSSIFYLPFFRLPVSGRASLSCFFLLTGFVNSLGYLRHVRSGNTHAALSGLAKSSFKRIGRIVAPTTAATVVNWGMCQIGLYVTAEKGDVDWIRDISPQPSESCLQALKELFTNIWTTWTRGSNIYDKVQWNLPFLLKASLVTYLILLMTTFVTPRARRLCWLLYYAYGWASGDVLISMNVCAGVFLADLLYDQLEPSTPTTLQSEKNTIPGSDTTSKVPLPAVLAFIAGAVMASYPENNPTWSPWSRSLFTIAQAIFPSSTEYDRAYGSIGVTLMIGGILHIPKARAMLANRVLVWTGRISFSVFLIHTMLLRTVFCWILFAGATQGEQMEGGQFVFELWLRRGGTFQQILAALVFFPVLYAVAHLWSVYVETACSQTVQWLEDQMFADPDGYDPVPV